MTGPDNFAPTDAAAMAKGIIRSAGEDGEDRAVQGANPRSAQPIAEIQRGARALAAHARRDAMVMAHGDAGAVKRLMMRQGEMLLLAGLSLIAEAGE